MTSAVAMHSLLHSDTEQHEIQGIAAVGKSEQRRDFSCITKEVCLCLPHLDRLSQSWCYEFRGAGRDLGLGRRGSVFVARDTHFLPPHYEAHQVFHETHCAEQNHWNHLVREDRKSTRLNSSH